MAKIVMYWNCPYCRTKEIPGYTRECGGCGHPRPKGITFYHSNPPHVATPEEAAMFGKPDPNWYCESCDSGNLAEKSKCWKCGDSRTTKSVVHEVRNLHSADLSFSEEEAIEANKVNQPEPKKNWEPDQNDPYNPQTPTSLDQEDSVVSSYTTPRYQRSTEKNQNCIAAISSNFNLNLRSILIAGGVVSAIIVLSLFIYAFFFKTHSEMVTVSKMNWSQTVRIEEYQTLHEEGWNIPAGGRETGQVEKDTGRDKKIVDGSHVVISQDTCYGTRNVPDTCYTNNGDGSSDSYPCTKSEPYSYPCTKSEIVEDYHYEDIYDTWYYYDIERWVTIGTYPTSGYGTDDIYYDSVQPSGSLQRRVEDAGRYTITFHSDNLESFSRDYNLEQYKTFWIHQEHEAVVNAFDVVLEVK